MRIEIRFIYKTLNLFGIRKVQEYRILHMEDEESIPHHPIVILSYITLPLPLRPPFPPAENPPPTHPHMPDTHTTTHAPLHPCSPLATADTPDHPPASPSSRAKSPSSPQP